MSRTACTSRPSNKGLAFSSVDMENGLDQTRKLPQAAGTTSRVRPAVEVAVQVEVAAVDRAAQAVEVAVARLQRVVEAAEAAVLLRRLR